MPQFSIKKINRYFGMAKEASLNSDFPRHQLGAIAVYKGNILAFGYNSCKTSPVQKKYNKERNYLIDSSSCHTNCLHAEVNCLNKIKFLDIDFSKVNLFVYRQHKNGVKALAKPCPACNKMIRDMGIKNIYFTIENGYSFEHYE